jgi:hypothetical protein
LNKHYKKKSTTSYFERENEFNQKFLVQNFCFSLSKSLKMEEEFVPNFKMEDIVSGLLDEGEVKF